MLRVLCREEFSVAAARTFVEDLKRAMQWLTGHFLYTPEQVIFSRPFQMQVWSTSSQKCIASLSRTQMPLHNPTSVF